MLFLSCVCYAFVRVCLYVTCGHLLGKGWPLRSRLWCLTLSLSLSHCILGQVWYLIVSIPELCTLTLKLCTFVACYAVDGDWTATEACRQF